MSLWFKPGSANYDYEGHYYRLTHDTARTYDIYVGSPPIFHRTVTFTNSGGLNYTLSYRGYWEPCEDPTLPPELLLDEGI